MLISSLQTKQLSMSDCKKAKYPTSCNALGVVLLKLDKQHLAENGFDPIWLTTVCSYLGVNPFWINRFILGFDHGAKIDLIKVTKDKSGKDQENKVQDDISRLGVK
jgi:hypothetical protein